MTPLSAQYTLYDSHDYERYKWIQNDVNRQKLDNSWVTKGVVAFVSKYIFNATGKPEFGLCHGTRRGLEQKWFAELLRCEVLGTEIADSATEFPDTIQWDFHETKPEWIDAVDFIYSNSLDHAYDPEKALNAWMSCLKVGHFCVLEYDDECHAPDCTSECDLFGVELNVFPYVILKWGKGRYAVREILDLPYYNKRHFVMIQRFET